MLERLINALFVGVQMAAAGVLLAAVQLGGLVAIVEVLVIIATEVVMAVSSLLVVRLKTRLSSGCSSIVQQQQGSGINSRAAKRKQLTSSSDSCGTTVEQQLSSDSPELTDADKQMFESVDLSSRSGKEEMVACSSRPPNRSRFSCGHEWSGLKELSGAK
jgi:hypothetical protein